MVLIDYLTWHYTYAPFRIVAILRNFLIGTWHRFLITEHFKTLFAPWHRVLVSEVTKHDTPQDKIINFIADTFFRFVAGIIRLIVIIVGLIWELVIIVFFIALLIAWILWPLIFVYALWQL